MNLLEENWLPVRRSAGHVDWIRPHQIAEPDIVAFAANRADFNGALAQMMIGLLQTSTTAQDEGEWEDLLNTPPSAQMLEQWFVPSAEAFVLDGDGARFMQDMNLPLTDGADCTVDGLLIDAAGGSAMDKNTDLFVKRDTIGAMCPHCVATALFTLQTNAPAGGAGHRTSVRGGGPLTTLVIATPAKTLWQTLWLNVKPQQACLLQGGDVNKVDTHFVFPWLADIRRIQAAGGETQPLMVHPHHVYWAMPRRIRLDFSELKTGRCDICKRESTHLLERYVTKPQGLNYKGPWRHPFSPYYETKEGWLAVHPQPGGFTYKNWLAWVLGVKQRKKSVQAAGIVAYFLQERKKFQSPGQFRLWVFGYDMDNMKARCWYETTFALYHLADADRDTQTNVQSLIANRIEAAEQTATYVRQAVKHAWFGDSDLRGDLSFVDKAFLDSTERSFYRQLEELLGQARTEKNIDLDDADRVMTAGQRWHKTLVDNALGLFDLDIVGAGVIAQQNPRRIAEAYNSLRKNLHGNVLREILGLPVPAKSVKAGNKETKSKPSIASQNQQSV